MRRGKEIAQGSHASMQFVVDQLRSLLQTNNNLTVELSSLEQAWILEGMAKVCLQVGSEEQLLEHHRRAQSQGIKSYLIRDSGRTEFAGIPTLTACAIGPDKARRN